MSIKPNLVTKISSLPDQRALTPLFSKRELEEVHAATHYPWRDSRASGSQSDFHQVSDQSTDKQSSATVNDTSDERQQPIKQRSDDAVRMQDKISSSASNISHFDSPVVDPEEYPFFDLNDAPEELVGAMSGDADLDSTSLDHDPHRSSRAISFGGGMSELLSHIKSFFNPPSSTEDAATTAGVGSLSSERATMESIPAMTAGVASLSNNSSIIGESESLDIDVVGDDLSETEQAATHKIADNIAEGDGESQAVVGSTAREVNVTPTMGSSSISSGSDLSLPVAEALRVTHLLDELTAAVSRLRLDSRDGKEMTIQLKREVLAETDIHIIATAKQVEVSFATRSQASNLLLNNHLVTLQNHLNALCPGQVVNIQTQLTSSASSSSSGNEQDPSHDDLASFDQRNRGNSSNDNDNL
jgi:hypothetical protein